MKFGPNHKIPSEIGTFLHCHAQIWSLLNLHMQPIGQTMEGDLN